ncbi:ion channel TACAN-like [Sycon ciliatum]|uniref:ion channel TACAN-like n=1 Tax=Sycon ciliatum TaxID=27933 RepID=UPI0031F66603|eukprot:scpid30184/ scgid32710/ Transmembrane protein 120A
MASERSVKLDRASQQWLNDWSTLVEEYRRIKESHRKLKLMLDDYAKHPTRIGKQLKDLKNSRARVSGTSFAESAEHLTQLDQMEKDLLEIRATLPKPNHIILQIVLGDLNVQMRNEKEKFAYKEQYEVFKLRVTIITCFLAISCFLFPSRTLDAVLHFLFVWYYCTVTIREHILRANGSRIKGWWLMHHYFSTIISGLLLVWPDDDLNAAFRPTFISFSMYMGLTQFIQAYYQRSFLIKRETLMGSRGRDISTDGVRVKTLSDLRFLIPFLFGAYIFQFYNAYVLITLWQYTPSATFHVVSCGVLFAIVGTGNLATTLMVLWTKYKQTKKA